MAWFCRFSLANLIPEFRLLGSPRSLSLSAAMEGMLPSGSLGAALAPFIFLSEQSPKQHHRGLQRGAKAMDDGAGMFLRRVLRV